MAQTNHTNPISWSLGQPEGEIKRQQASGTTGLAELLAACKKIVVGLRNESHRASMNFHSCQASEDRISNRAVNVS